jgi:hypothetical protein
VAALAAVLALAGCADDKSSNSTSTTQAVGGDGSTSVPSDPATTGPLDTSPTGPTATEAIATYTSINSLYDDYLRGDPDGGGPTRPVDLNDPRLDEWFVGQARSAQRAFISSNLTPPYTAMEGPVAFATPRNVTVDDANTVRFDDCMLEGRSGYDPASGDGALLGFVTQKLTVTMSRESSSWRISRWEASDAAGVCQRANGAGNAPAVEFVG